MGKQTFNKLSEVYYIFCIIKGQDCPELKCDNDKTGALNIYNDYNEIWQANRWDKIHTSC